MNESLYSEQAPWWRATAIHVGEHLHFTLGPLQLWIEYEKLELHVASVTQSDPFLNTVSLEKSPEIKIPSECSRERYAIGQNEMTLRFEPILPNRAIVTRPAQPLWIHGGRSVDIFVSSPVWIRVVDQTSETTLMEIPSIELSNTWFGPHPYEGELCYASRTQARLNPTKLLTHPVRAITRITIDNRLNDPVHVKRLKIPMGLLALYHDSENNLWTTSMRLERRNAGGPAQIRLAEPTGLADRQFTRLAMPQTQNITALIERALNKLVS